MADAPLSLNLPALRTNLLGFHVNSFPHSPEKDSGHPAPGTGLLPTSFDPESGNFVNTSAEADLIGLSLALGEDNLARELLYPYWHKSLRGTQALHDSYDGYTRAARTKDPLLPRAPASHQNIEAQLSIAEASFIVGLKTGDTNLLTLGRNLVVLVLDRFQSTNRVPHGVTTLRALNDWDFLGTRLWPEGAHFSTRWNARACLLFRQLDTPAIRAALWPQDTNWTQPIHDAALDSEAWLRTNLLPEVTRTGVVPSGVFEIQDVHGKTTALTPERSTSAAGWLDFLLAADAIGVPRESTRHWLDNLAKTHGVTINGIWGLDEAIALDRPDVISPALTAHFARVAAVLDHLPAASFARRQLAAQTRPDGWPVAITADSSAKPINIGNGSWLFPDTARTNWPVSFAVPADLLRPAIQTTTINPNQTATLEDKLDRSRTDSAVSDLAVFVTITALFYLVILGTAIFWWRFRGLRGKADASVGTSPIMPEPSMQRAEEGWAKRVLGVQTPPGSENTRFSNAPVEHNFLMQLRAIYKLAVEWRRQENDWAEDDVRIADDESDPWLNGMDEFASIVGIYMRWVIKAGAKDGFERADILTEHEDSNHIWSRLVMYFAEFYWGLLVLVDQFNNVVIHDDKARVHGEIARLLTALGVRERTRAFDARVLFNCPANPQAMDLLVIQKPGATLEKVLMGASLKLRIPISHLTGFVEKYKTFKRREQPWPIHPYIIEMAKMLPHFGIMGLGALVWYNQRVGENPIVAYLWDLFGKLVYNPASLLWGVPLIAGTACTILGHITRIYRFTAPMLPRIQNSTMMLDRTITGLFARGHDVMPGLRKGRGWDPNIYDRAAWVLRAIGFTILGITLLGEEPPSFATFLTVKGIFAMIAFAEVGAIVLPLAAGFISKWLQDHSATAPAFRGLLQFIHKLNITATRPASPLWLSIKYHTQPSAPSGDRASTIQTVVFYFVFAALFAFVGAYLCQEMFPLWFTEKYLTAANWKLVLGGFVFWNTMYLLRYGLFLAFTGIASFTATFPIKALFIMFAAAQAVLVCLEKINGSQWQVSSTISYAVAAIGLVLIWFESPLVSWFRARRSPTPASNSDELGGHVTAVVKQATASSEEARQSAPPASNLGVVYMSGDDLSHLKLTPALLMSRWTILRDRLDSSGVELLFGLAGRPDDATLERWFTRLYESEKKAEVTLWHPCQLCVNEEKSIFDSNLGLHIQVESAEAREELITTWHLRRWLVTMMSTAGHAQDTAITLVDIAARLHREGLAGDTAFYLVQNKYDNNDNNRPSQTPYDKGELAHRNKLARLLKQLAPGCRAYSIQNWTPFGFKAGGLTGMDLAYEEAMRLTTMLVLDRNANVHDLDALMIDLRTALNDPDVIIVIPGRGTTNTLTPLGQASQMVEEGHRSFLKGLMTWLGGRGSEMVGTGWGNLLACYYGRTQRAMLDPTTPKMPLTSRMRRGSSFAVRVEGLIGFTPHAVGISEDTWAVLQTAHNAMALGRRVKFLLSRAIWHKIRETWSHAEWLASFPRWSGGFLQMMHDPLMQQINDFGPASVFAKEVRSNSGRNFLTAPFALLNILLMPLAIMLDVTPFIEILVVLWNFGFVMNQILTIHGLNVYLESSGFSRTSALVGGGIAGAALWAFPAWQIFGPAVLLAGFIAGGFVAGLSRWLYCRVRDIILFGPQLVLHTLGQLVRQSLEFSVSGASPEDARGVNMAFRTSAGPREDRPLDTFPTFINLRTIIWVVGLVAIFLNVVALSNLDMLNVLLLLPSLLFSVSIFVGPFLMTPKPGKRIGLSIAFAKILGWGATLALLTGVSVMFGRGGWLAGFSILAMIIVIALLLFRALRFSLVHRGVKAARRRFQTLLINTGVAQDIAGKLAAQFASDTQGDRAKIEAALRQNSVPEAAHELVIRAILEDTAPALRRPVDILTRSRFAQNRFVSAFARSFLLSYFVLIWFFIVPVPGIFVFTARDYRISLRHEDILTTVFCVVAMACAAFWIGRAVNWWKRTGMGAGSLESSVMQAHEQLRRNLAAGTPLNAASTSAAFALLTDAQTYVDQQSPAHARNAIKSARLHLKPGR
ncbi:MAG: hypothetical protein EXS31_16965 [Pedosphaera sp.]|nr:hypothetical protein [Pedosphaera sp.]